MTEIESTNRKLNYIVVILVFLLVYVVVTRDAPAPRLQQDRQTLPVVVEEDQNAH